MRYKNRMHAAMQLAPLLEKYRYDDGVVLAVPRGGVPVGSYIARYLDFPLEVLLSKKLGHPNQPEYAIGAVTLEDAVYERRFDIPEAYVTSQINKIRKELQARFELYLSGKEPLDLKGKTLIVVDDGIATGHTLKATLNLLRKKMPKKLIVAVPVAPLEMVEAFQGLVDEFVCANHPKRFSGVGAFYEDFSPVDDKEVALLLQKANGKRSAA